jgi:hypothetical protein
MEVCRECSDEGFVGYVMALRFDSVSERDAWVTAHISSLGHSVMHLTGGWLSPRDVRGYMQAVNWAAVGDGSALSDGRFQIGFAPEDEVHR